MRRILALLIALTFTAATAQTTIRYTHFQPGRPDQPKHAAALAFERFVERASDGSIQVDLFPASQLGDAAEVLEGLQLGTIQMGVVHDGPISGFFRPLEQITAANTGYYLITYRSPRKAGEIGYQRVEVRSADPEIRILARRGYRFGL